MQMSKRQLKQPFVQPHHTQCQKMLTHVVKHVHLHPHLQHDNFLKKSLYKKTLIVVTKRQYQYTLFEYKSFVIITLHSQYRIHATALLQHQ